MSASVQSHPAHSAVPTIAVKTAKKWVVIRSIVVIAATAFSATGCSTLQALEPTAILISDIKNSL